MKAVVDAGSGRILGRAILGHRQDPADRSTIQR